jgi:hypothetical protein
MEALALLCVHRACRRLDGRAEVVGTADVPWDRKMWGNQGLSICHGRPLESPKRPHRPVQRQAPPAIRATPGRK